MISACIGLVIQLVTTGLSDKIRIGYIDDMDGNLLWQAEPMVVGFLAKVFPQRQYDIAKNHVSIRLRPEELQWIFDNVQAYFYIDAEKYLEWTLRIDDIRTSGGANNTAERWESFYEFVRIQQTHGYKIMSSSQAIIDGINNLDIVDQSTITPDATTAQILGNDGNTININQNEETEQIDSNYQSYLLPVAIVVGGYFLANTK
mgnify:CR=1 FL=1